ncbi:MAG: HAMP domain-containing protein [Zoogloeaceae bacterium]|jgi:nitrogen fixation/metabolism regulation signal transduction histidine kinase|nr:HAMP domain-containing protein [Zoogloeaceae bacterium]
MKRLLVILGIFGATLGGILWLLLLASTSADSPVFSGQYPLILGLNTLLSVALLGFVGWQLFGLWREYRAQVFGSRLKLRLTLMFGLVAILPGALVYGVSVQVITHSIESWFDVRVEKALESGLNLGRSVLDSRLGELTQKARGLAQELEGRPEATQRAMLARLREQAGVDSIALFSASGQLLASAQGGLGDLLPPLPSPAELKRARTAEAALGDAEELPAGIELKQTRTTRVFSVIDSAENGDMSLRVLLPIASLTLFEPPHILQLAQAVPSQLAQNAEAVQEVYQDYRELQLAREGLTRIYALTLTLTVLMALFAAFSLAFFLARRLSAPLSILAEGTEAVAQGDYSPRQAIHSRDELGMLTQSFNQMMRQLDDARREAGRHRSEVESARAYLESILANLSAGVLVFDRQGVLRTLNEGAATILGQDLIEDIGQAASDWPRYAGLGRFIQQHFEAADAGEWQGQLELEPAPEQATTPHKTLLLRGTRLPKTSGSGHVVVFDDVTQLIVAQRNAAWGEVARRLAHEIKNPLTPIQLSAERLQMKLAAHLEGRELEMLERATQTIINQVQAMKRMVDDFRDYARHPAPELAALDLNALIGEVLGLYENSSVRPQPDLDAALPPILGDATQIRQVIHNLLKNAQDALETRENPELLIRTRHISAEGAFATLEITDNGNGFPAEVLPRAFEPYITTKPRGTGLGLPIVKRIIDEHLGSIEISNRPEGGAHIRIRLPLLTIKTEESMEKKDGGNPDC